MFLVLKIIKKERRKIIKIIYIKFLIVFLLFGCSESSENSPKFKTKNIHDIEKHLN